MCDDAGMTQVSKMVDLTSFNRAPPDPPGSSAGGTAHGEGSRLSQNAVCRLRDSALSGGWKNQKIQN